jgi:hypothetical protein
MPVVPPPFVTRAGAVHTSILSAIRSWHAGGQQGVLWVFRRGGSWLPLAGLAVLLLLFARHDLGQLRGSPIPPRSQHNAWELVPRMIHVFDGYRETSDAVIRGNWAYACPRREPIPWSEPAAVLRELGHGRLSGLVGDFKGSYWVEMPHSLALAAAAAWLVPGHVEVPALVMLGYVLLLIVSVYGVAREAHGPWTGLLAAALCAQSPALIRYTLAVEGYLPVTALTAASIWSLLRSRGFTRPLPALAWLALAWTAVRSGEGFSEAVGTGLAVAVPFLIEVGAGVIEQRRAGRSSWRPVAIATIVLATFLALLDHEWVRGGLSHILFGFEEGSAGAVPAAPGMGPIATFLGTHLAYIALIWSAYLGPFAATALLLGLPGLLSGALRRRWSLLAWLLVPLAAYGWMTRKAEWYALPLIPSLAVVAAVGLTASRWTHARAVTAVGVALAVLGLGAHGVLPAPWYMPARGLSRLLCPDLVHLRTIGQQDDSRTRSLRDLERFVDWSWNALPPDGSLHHVVVTGRAEVPLFHYAMVLLRHDLEPVIPPSQPLDPCLGPDDVELLLNASPEGGLRPLGRDGTPEEIELSEPWRARLVSPAGAPPGVYRVRPIAGGSPAASQARSGATPATR